MMKKIIRIVNRPKCFYHHLTQPLKKAKAE